MAHGDSFQRERGLEWVVVNSRKDMTGQGGVVVSPFSLKGLSPDQFPLMKATSTKHSQTSGDSGGNMITPDTQHLMPGDYCLARPDNTTSGRQWTFEGHQGTLVDHQGGSPGSSYMFKALYSHGDPQSGIPRLNSGQGQASKYPQDGIATILNNPGIQHKADDTADSRKHTEKHLGSYPKRGQQAQESWNKDQHIMGTQDDQIGHPIPHVIQQQDQTKHAEAQQSDHGVQVLGRLREEANQPDFVQHFQHSMNGTIQTIHSLMENGSGLGGGGMTGNILGMFEQYISMASSTGAQQNQNIANNQSNNTVTVLKYHQNANGQLLDANGNLVLLANQEPHIMEFIIV